MTQLMDEKLAVQSNKNADRDFDFSAHNQHPIQKPIVIHQPTVIRRDKVMTPVQQKQS